MSSTDRIHPDGDLDLPSLGIPLHEPPPPRWLNAAVVVVVALIACAAVVVPVARDAEQLDQARARRAAELARAASPAAVDMAYREGVADTLAVVAGCPAASAPALAVRLARGERP